MQFDISQHSIFLALREFLLLPHVGVQRVDMAKLRATDGRSNVELRLERHVQDLSVQADRLRDRVATWSGPGRLVAVWHTEGQVS